MFHPVEAGILLLGDGARIMCIFYVIWSRQVNKNVKYFADWRL